MLEGPALILIASQPEKEKKKSWHEISFTHLLVAHAMWISWRERHTIPVDVQLNNRHRRGGERGLATSRETHEGICRRIGTAKKRVGQLVMVIVLDQSSIIWWKLELLTVSYYLAMSRRREGGEKKHPSSTRSADDGRNQYSPVRRLLVFWWRTCRGAERRANTMTGKEGSSKKQKGKNNHRNTSERDTI